MDHDWEGPYTDECGRHDITKRKLKEVQEERDRLLEELAQARMVARDLFWSEIPPEKIEEVAARTKCRLRMEPSEYLAWLED